MEMMDAATVKRCHKIGYLAFLLSGTAAIGSGIIVSVLQERYGIAYDQVGTLLSIFSIGNMLAAFLAGVLPGKIGVRSSVLTLSFGYFLGYGLMGLSGQYALLIFDFFLIGLAKGTALNRCSVLVGYGAEGRASRMNLMHACYAFGALICPFLLSYVWKIDAALPIYLQAVVGLMMWLVFLIGRLPETEAQGKRQGRDFSFLKSRHFWLIAAILFCQNAAETSVIGWMVTYFKDTGILSGVASTYTVSILWGMTLVARLLIAFVFPVKRSFHALALMGGACTVLYVGLILCTDTWLVLLLLSLFAFSMAGVNPITIAAVGSQLRAESLSVILPIGSIGAILMPWVIGVAADSIGLRMGMLTNLIPCAGIFLISLYCMKQFQGTPSEA